MKKRTTTKAEDSETRRKRKAAKRRATKTKTPMASTKRSRKRKTPNRAGTGSAPRTSRKRRVVGAWRAVQPAAAARPRTARAAIPEAFAAVGAWQRIAPHVAARLRARGWDDPDPDVVRTIAALAAGYRKGPAADPPFATAVDGDAAVADAFIDFYSMGARSPAPERRARLSIVRRTVSFNLRQFGIAASNLARDTLARIALGIWRPGLDEIARLNGLASFLVPWYRAGLA